MDAKRTLPNGVSFSSTITPGVDGVRMKMTLTNGTDKTLVGLRVQNCVMLKMAKGFNAQTNDNKVLQKPYAACRGADGKRWIITAWEPYNRTWDNARCPCVHSDPKFPDCKPGETVKAHGRLSFYEGRDVEIEFRRIEQTGWHEK